MTLYALSSQAKGSKSNSFLTHIRNEVDFVPFAFEDVYAHACG